MSDEVRIIEEAGNVTIIGDDESQVTVTTEETNITVVGGSAPTALTSLTDTPNNYDSASLKVLRVNAGETGVEFVDLFDDTGLQTALNGKVDENSAITGATKTKITYDAKGLVTVGEDATTADIADSTDARYVTDAQLVVIGNTSGTNTGDQESSDFSHNSLSGLNDGTDYEHITQTQKDALHNAVTVTDSSEIDFTLTGQDISASIKTGSIDILKLDSGVQSSLGLADSALQSESDTLQSVTDRGSVTTNTSTFGNIIDNGLTASLGVYTDSNKQLTSTPPTSGYLGFWNRTGTELKPATMNDTLNMISELDTYSLTGTATIALTLDENYDSFMGEAGGATWTATIYGYNTSDENYTANYITSTSIVDNGDYEPYLFSWNITSTESYDYYKIKFDGVGGEYPATYWILVTDKVGICTYVDNEPSNFSMSDDTVIPNEHYANSASILTGGIETDKLTFSTTTFPVGRIFGDVRFQDDVEFIGDVTAPLFTGDLSSSIITNTGTITSGKFNSPSLYTDRQQNSNNFLAINKDVTYSTIPSILKYWMFLGNASTASSSELAVMNLGAYGANGGASINVYSNNSASMPTTGAQLGSFGFGGRLGSYGSLTSGAGLKGYATENWASGKIGTKFIFSTTPTGQGTPLDVLELNDYVWLKTDNTKFYFGTAQDASIYYNGTNLVINPQEVGSGILRIKGDFKIGDIDSIGSEAWITIAEYDGSITQTDPSDYIVNTLGKTNFVSGAGNILTMDYNGELTQPQRATMGWNYFGPLESKQFRVTALNSAPSSASATGTLGEIRITSTYVYICTATNTWKRVAISTW